LHLRARAYLSHFTQSLITTYPQSYSFIGSDMARGWISAASLFIYVYRENERGLLVLAIIFV
ncbi:hypothetical protein NHG86_17550, partial [Vibrio cholerae]|uniref:hypothetical protein n=1 Tax=Vibrio cholerae TaxID=666 RepID=UPI00353173E1